MSEEPITLEQVEEIEALLRVVRRRTPLLVIGAVVTVIAIALASFAVVLTSDADQKISALSAEAAANQQQAREFQGFLQRFIAEQNYMCSIAADTAVREGLPLPPKGLCAVVLPTPRPSAPVTPSPAQTVAPVAPRPTAAPTAASARPIPSAAPTATVATASPAPRCLLGLVCLRPAHHARRVRG